MAGDDGLTGVCVCQNFKLFTLNIQFIVSQLYQNKTYKRHVNFECKRMYKNLPYKNLKTTSEHKTTIEHFTVENV